MKRLPFLNNKGMAFVSVVGLLGALTVIGVLANQNSLNDNSLLSRNLQSLQALYVAEAGIERARAECTRRYIQRGWSSFNPIILGADETYGTSDDGMLSFGATANYHGGTYSVRVVNDAKDPGGTSADTNNTVTIESTGSYEGKKVTIHTTFKVNKIPQLNGAINFIGEADTGFDGTSFIIDGRDYRIADTDTPTGTSPQYGVSMSDGSSSYNVISSLSDGQKLNVLGTDYDASSSPPTPSVGMDTSITKEDITTLVAAVKSVADNVLINPTDLKDVNLGSTASPKITYVQKTDSTALKITGNMEGAGLLIIEGGVLEITITGNMGWVGVIIVAGDNVGFKETGGSNIKGSLLISQTSSNIAKEFEIGGNATLKYSSEAIILVNDYINTKKTYTTLSWRRVE